MPRRDLRAGQGAHKGSSRKTPLNAPFRGLRGRLRPPEPATPIPPAPAKGPATPVAPADDETLFTLAMEGVARFDPRSRARIDGPTPAPEPRPPISEDAEAMAALSDLANGDAPFHVSDTREYVEGYVVGLDPRLVRRLRRGDFSWQTHLDLHGMTAADARDAVERFITAGVRDGHRCVLLVHGRGRNSKDQVPVLKESIKSWLARGRIGRLVLAFTTARPVDGGAGAVYVLLRRDRRRRPMLVTEGAKR